LDQTLNVIDLASGEVIKSDSFEAKNGAEARSIYSVAVDPNLRSIATGCPDKVIRFFDIRSGNYEFELKGHTDNIRALKLHRDGTFCLSGSSDGSLRMWDLRQRSCLTQAKYHDDSVWAIAADESFECIVTGGREGSVYLFDPLKKEPTLLQEEVGPVASLALSSRNDQIWVAANSKKPIVARWSFAPMEKEPQVSISIRPGIVKCQALNDRQHVLSQDSDGDVSRWQVGTARKVEDYGQVDFDDMVSQLTKLISVPSWFTVAPCASGLKVTLEKSTAFSAEIPVADVDGAEDIDEEEDYLNIGAATSRALFQGWLDAQDVEMLSLPASENPRTLSRVDRNESRGGMGGGMGGGGMRSSKAVEVRGAVPEHIFKQLPTRTVLTVVPGGESNPILIKRVEELDGTELLGHVPNWIADCLTLGPLKPKEIRVTFKVKPLEGSTCPAFDGPNQLTAPNTLIMEKSYKWVAGKLGKLNEDEAARPEEILDLFCNGKRVPPNITIAAVQECLWRNRPTDGQDAMLLLEYDLRPTARDAGKPRV